MKLLQLGAVSSHFVVSRIFTSELAYPLRDGKLFGINSLPKLTPVLKLDAMKFALKRGAAVRKRVALLLQFITLEIKELYCELRC
jgi:hypothetical protein